jgi:hypothetical protein
MKQTASGTSLREAEGRAVVEPEGGVEKTEAAVPRSSHSSLELNNALATAARAEENFGKRVEVVE